jgi:hypothetical protein
MSEGCSRGWAAPWGLKSERCDRGRAGLLVDGSGGEPGRVGRKDRERGREFGREDGML